MPRHGPNLPTLGTLSYNGYAWNALTQSRIRATPEPSDSGRTIKMVKQSIWVRGTVTATDEEVANGTGTDDQLMDMRQRLSEPGQTLMYNLRGYGELAVNRGKGGTRDINFGPRPRLLSFTPKGGGNAAIVEWECDTWLAECPKAATSEKLMMLEWSLAVAYDRAGLAKVTITGAAEIPLVWSNDRRLKDNAEAYWEKIFPPPPPEFQLQDRSYTLSADRKRLDFTVVMQELPHALPRGTVLADVQHEVISTGTRGGFGQFTNTITGTIHTAPERRKEEAAARFLAIATQRIFHTLDQAQQARRANVPGNKRPVVILTNFRAVEDLFTNTSRFSLSYTITGTSLVNILVHAGLWKPLDLGRNPFKSWQDSLKDGAHHPRGRLKMRFANSSDTVIDLCDSVARNIDPFQRGAAPVGPNPAPTVPGEGDARVHNPNPVVASLPFDDDGMFGDPIAFFGGGDFSRPEWQVRPMPGLEPEATWLSYDVHPVYAQDNHFMRHKPLSGQVGQAKIRPGVDALGDVRQVAAQVGPDETDVRTTVDDIFQRVAAPSSTVSLVGSASRIGYPIAAPRLERFGGVEVVELWRVVVPAVVGRLGPYPIFGLAWQIHYGLVKPPRRMSHLANPLYGISGTGKSG